MTAPLVLIVEDCVETRDCCVELFRPPLLAVQRRVPDVVLTDIDMPLLDGIGLALRLRDLPETARLPIVAITETGCDAVLLKPCPAKSLLASVHAQLRRSAPTTRRAGSMP